MSFNINVISSKKMGKNGT